MKILTKVCNRKENKLSMQEAQKQEDQEKGKIRKVLSQADCTYREKDEKRIRRSSTCPYITHHKLELSSSYIRIQQIDIEQLFPCLPKHQDSKIVKVQKNESISQKKLLQCNISNISHLKNNQQSISIGQSTLLHIKKQVQEIIPSVKNKEPDQEEFSLPELDIIEQKRKEKSDQANLHKLLLNRYKIFSIIQSLISLLTILVSVVSQFMVVDKILAKSYYTKEQPGIQRLGQIIVNILMLVIEYLILREYKSFERNNQKRFLLFIECFFDLMMVGRLIIMLVANSQFYDYFICLAIFRMIKLHYCHKLYGASTLNANSI